MEHCVNETLKCLGCVKGILINFKKPNGVTTAILWTSVALLGIWWYALLRSTLEKMVVPLRLEEKSCMWGNG